jgi:hypothetical protein
MTLYGLSMNLEAGVFVGPPAAAEVVSILKGLILDKLVYLTIEVNGQRREAT